MADQISDQVVVMQKLLMKMTVEAYMKVEWSIKIPTFLDDDEPFGESGVETFSSLLPSSAEPVAVQPE